MLQQVTAEVQPRVLYWTTYDFNEEPDVVATTDPATLPLTN